jgi:threonine dehydratase
MKLSSKLNVSLGDIESARTVLSEVLSPTPLIRSAWLSEKFRAEVFLKLETMQPIGSFKIRGATYRIACLSDVEKKRGVIAASAGNHAQGVAWGAKTFGTSACIVMPKNAPLLKVENTRNLGAEVLLYGNNYDEAFSHAQTLIRKSRRVYIHAFHDERVIAGQGTLGLEIVEQLPGVDWIFGSIGGGGMMAGIGAAIRGMGLKTRLVGAQSSGAPSMAQSFRKKRPIELSSMETFADGIAVRRAQPEMYRFLRGKLNQVLEASDGEIAEAVVTLLERAKIVSEGAAAVGLAVMDQVASKLRGKRVCLVVGGGNIDVNVLGRVIDQGLIRKQRRVRILVTLSDRPGSLALLTQAIAEAGANVIQAIHDRNEPSLMLHRTEVALTLETRGPEHRRQVLDAIRPWVLSMQI